MPTISPIILYQSFYSQVIQRPAALSGFLLQIYLKKCLLFIMMLLATCCSYFLFACIIINLHYFAKSCAVHFTGTDLPLFKKKPFCLWIVSHAGVLLALAEPFLTWGMHSTWASISVVSSSFQASSSDLTLLRFTFSFPQTTSSNFHFQLPSFCKVPSFEVKCYYFNHIW